MAASGIRMGGVFVEIGADAAKFFSAFRGVSKELDKVGKSVQSAGQKMTALGAGIVGPIFASAAAFAHVGSTLYDMSKRTGVATEALSVLQFAANQTGTDMGSVEIAVKKMQKAIYAAGNGSKEAADSLAMVGLTAGDLAGLSADQQMGMIADGLMAIKDPGARAAIAMQIFGKSGTAVLPMLESGSAGMAAFAAEAKRLGLVMDSETAAKADALGDALDSVKASMKMAFITVGAAVAPMLTKMAQALSVVTANAGKFISENHEFIGVVFKAGAALTVLGAAIFGIGTAMRGVSAAISVVMKSLGMLSALASPIFLLGAAIVAAGAAAYQFRDQIAGALSSVGGYVSQAAGVIGETFGPAVSDAQAVLGDLYATASTTFSGIYEAISAGDMSGAMDVLWAGLVAGWLRGVEALMSYVDPFVSALQDTFTIVGAEIYKAWDATWVAVGNAFNIAGAYLSGVMDNVINGLLASWDFLEAGIRKAWVRIQYIFGNGRDKQAELDAIDAEMSARADARQASRPGIAGRVETASQQNEVASNALNARNDSVNAGTTEAIATRIATQQRLNADRAALRRQETMSAQQRLESLTADIAQATTVPQDVAAADAAVVSPGELPSPPDTTSRGTIAGTFSSLNLGAAFGGQSAADRTAKACEAIERNTRDMKGDKVAA